MNVRNLEYQLTVAVFSEYILIVCTLKAFKLLVYVRNVQFSEWHPFNNNEKQQRKQKYRRQKVHPLGANTSKLNETYRKKQA